MKALLLTATTIAIFGAAPAAAQNAPASAGPSADPKVSQLVIYGDDKCPAGNADTIIVCHKLPERERFRIPENLRSDPNDPANQAWATRASELQFAGRSGIGSCSTTGPGGMVGCFNQIVREARAERNSPDNVNWNLLVEQARQERLSKIDAEARAIEGEPPK